MRLSVLYILLSAALIVGGCMPPKYTKPITQPPADPKARNFEAAWNSCRDTLKKYGYNLDRQDKRDGIITTYATPGGQFFEFWRKDSATTFNWRENNLQTILRAARVKITPVAGSNNYEFTVEVAMARSDKVAPEATTTGDERKVTEGGVMAKAYSYGQGGAMSKLTFNDLLKAPSSKALPRSAKPRSDYNPASMIVPLGMDHDLEAKITQSIQDAVDTYDHRKAGAWVSF